MQIIEKVSLKLVYKDKCNVFGFLTYVNTSGFVYKSKSDFITLLHGFNQI